MIQQFRIQLPPFSRGFHLITDLIYEGLPSLPEMGLAHIFIQHTSAGLSLNENADPSVRYDFEQIFNRLVPENQPYYTHTMEGTDDMPAHVKSSLVGASVSVPISAARFALGTWQGIYLCEFRNYGGARKLLVSVQS
ncbi:MAG: secondary thiamine-phosphate synthase enzyme YjbQ [Bacteroidota bacterium]